MLHLRSTLHIVVSWTMLIASCASGAHVEQVMNTACIVDELAASMRLDPDSALAIWGIDSTVELSRMSVDSLNYRCYCERLPRRCCNGNESMMCLTDVCFVIRDSLVSAVWCSFEAIPIQDCDRLIRCAEVIVGCFTTMFGAPIVSNEIDCNGIVAMHPITRSQHLLKYSGSPVTLGEWRVTGLPHAPSIEYAIWVTAWIGETCHLGVTIGGSPEVYPR